jgi:seryl-tRNA synthetase
LFAHGHDDDRGSGTLLVQAEVLYESFLTARVQRARKMLETAKLDLRRNPANKRLSTQIKETQREIEALQVQLEQQTARTAETRKQVETAKREPLPPTPNTPVPDVSPKVNSGQDFRIAQSAKALEAVQSAAIKRLLEAYRSKNPEAIFKAAQALRAEQRGEIRPGETNSSLPTDFLSPEEITALRKPDTRS